MKVFLVDDHELIRCGVRQALAQRGHEVVAEAGTSAEAMRRLPVLDIDAAVVDIRLPDGSGLDVVRALRRRMPRLGVVVLTMFPTDEALFEALEAGANALVGKESSLAAISNALTAAIADPSSFMAKDLTSAMKRRMSAPEPLLTARESQVLTLMAEGLSVAQIARRLYVSESTAKTHAAKIYQKLGAGNRAQAVMVAVRRGILPTSAQAG